MVSRKINSAISDRQSNTTGGGWRINSVTLEYTDLMGSVD